MKINKKFDYYITAVFAITIVVITATSYFTFKEIFARSTQKQQEAIMPLFSLITSEIIRPITISQYMAQDPFLIDYIEQDKIDQSVIFDYITSISDKSNILAFIAMEKHQLLIDSNNKVTSLKTKNTEWYHRLKVIDKNQFTDIGDAENPHLFFDVKMINKEGDFLGFVGLGVDLDYFADKLKEYKNDYGFEVYFIDENNHITLSSSDLMKTTFHHRQDNLTNISELGWYQNYQEATKNNNKDSNNSAVFNFANDDLIVSQMELKDLNWHAYIVAPPVTKQSNYWTIFMQNLFVFIIVSFALYYIFTLCIRSFRTDLIKDSKTDFLTQLPNRSFIHWKYSQLSNQYTYASVVLADIDNFKKLNDSYGHLVGDDVLKVVAKELGKNLRTIDIVGRWGGEEFIFILPDTDAKKAQLIVDRIRENIANIPFTPASTSKHFNVTVSFGISESKLANNELEVILDKADKALYNAKINGRNQVVVNLE